MVRCASAVEGTIVNWILIINDCDEPPNRLQPPSKRKETERPKSPKTKWKKRRKKARLASIKFRKKNANLEMKQNEEMATFLANKILFINEVFSTCPINMLANLKIQLEHAFSITWKDRTPPPTRSANRKNFKDPMDERNYRERNNKAVQKTLKIQKRS